MSDEVLVIGAGIVGAACAARLVQAGRKVAIVDRLGPGEGCSFGNAGGLSPTISFPLATPEMFRHIPGWLLDADGPLVVAWRHLPAAASWLLKFVRQGLPKRSAHDALGMRNMMRGTMDDYAPLFAFAKAEFLIHRVGQMYVFDTERGFADEQRAIAARAAYGVSQKVLNAVELRDYEPMLSPAFKHGVYFPTHAHCADPQRLVQMLIRACTEGGARFVSGSVSEVESLEGGVRVHGLSEPLDVSQVVLAGGIHSNDLLRPLGLKVPLESHRGYHVQVPHGTNRPTRNVMWSEMKTLVTPMDNGVRVAGTAEIAGVEAAPNPRRFELLRRAARQIYPDLRHDASTEWMGHRPCTPDSLPVIGPVPGHPNVICAFGHGHVGLSGASFTGRVVRDIVAGTARPETWSPYSIERFR